MTNVTCNLPVVAPGAWAGGGARPWCYNEAQICHLMGSSIRRDFQNFFSRTLLPRSIPVTGLPDPVHYHTLKVLGLEYWERNSLQRLQKNQTRTNFQ